MEADAPSLAPGVSAGASEEPTPEPSPTATPRPQPTVALLLNDSDVSQQIRILDGPAVDVALSLVTNDLRRSDCTIEHRFVPDAPGGAETTKSLAPSAEQTVALLDGWHHFTARCPSIDGPLTSTVSVLAADGQPERCADFDFPSGTVAVTTAEELAAGMVGHWSGCVTTPWVPVYWVYFTFRMDGGYSAHADEVLDDMNPPALYYGTDADAPRKVWRVLEFADGLGAGEIVIVFGSGSTNTDDLLKIRLMGDALSFEMIHHDRYGPLVFRLIRA